MLTTTDLHRAAYSILSHDPLNPCSVTPLIETRGSDINTSTNSPLGIEDPRTTITFLLAVAIQASDATLDELRSTGDHPYSRIIGMCADEEAVRYAHWLTVADMGASWFATWRKAYTECGLLVDERVM